MSNIGIVKAFLDGLHKPISQVSDHLRASLAEDAEWGNSGFPPAVGIEDIVSKHKASQQVFGDYVMEVQLLNIAVDGDVVFSERIDIGRTQEGEEILTVPVVGVFVVRDGKIVRWTDYFDPTGLLKSLSAVPDVDAYFAGKSTPVS